MRRNRQGFRSLGVLIVSAVIAFGGLVVSSPVDAAPSAAKAKAVAAEETGGSADQFNVVNVVPLADTGIVQFKVMDSRGNVVGIDLDQKGARVRDEETKKKHAKKDRKFKGKIEDDLERALKHMKDDDTLKVVMWMEGTTNEPRRGPDVSQTEYDANLQAVAGQVSAMMAAPMHHWTSMGGSVIYAPPHTPMVVAKGSKAAVMQMAQRNDVQRIFLERTHSERLNVSRVAVQANTVNGRGINGTGQRVAVVEAGRIAAHANLPAAQRVNCFGTIFGILFSGVSGHKTNVAGVIQSTHPTQRGMAPNITIVDGIAFDLSDGEVMAATDCVIDNEAAGAVNMSFGSETNGFFDAFARFVDRKVYMTGRTIVPAVSNTCANRMGTPEIAFNVIAVGAFSDNNTFGFADDFHACAVGFSAFLNPFSTNGDREEPDVVAPGDLINTTTSAGGFANANGTSFAAPHVTALAGLLIQRDPSLASQTERLRAIVMASARHNIEGASRLSDRDGAGAIEMAAADGVLLDGLSSFFSSPGGTTGFPMTRTFFASAGQRVRVAIAWSHKSPGGDTLTGPTTDLDLRVTGPTAAFVAGSFSFDNTYEIVDFTAPLTGTYTATINNFRSSAGAEFIGFAASRVDF